MIVGAHEIQGADLAATSAAVGIIANPGAYSNGIIVGWNVITTKTTVAGRGFFGRIFAPMAPARAARTCVRVEYGSIGAANARLMKR